MIARVVVLAALLSACCKPTVVERPVLVQPPPCRERDAPDPPEGAAAGGQRWADWFALELVPWILEVETACPRREYDDEPAPGHYGG